ncbi:MAG: glycosyltransferase family 2 protein [Candidatus Aegiribacteria sp.]|nr:glycosyltransferase family 2 protein [Candidatus Aegiribacteria sp.]
MNLSLVVITLNEENNIGRCLNSVPFASEMIVVDSGSTDSTVTIAEKHGAKVFSHVFESFSKQKQWAIEQASGDWILSLDADENLDAELSSELESLLVNDTEHIAFRLPFRILYMRKLMKFGPWSGEYHARLFRKGHAHFPDTGIHEGLLISRGSIGTVKRGFVVHRSYDSISEQMDKMLRYSRLWAEEEYQKRRKSNIFQILLRPAWRFVSAYIFRGGILEGVPGLTASAISAFYVFLKWAILFEMSISDR